MTAITPDLIRQALQHVPADLPRDEWAKVGMAIKSEYPDDTGFDLFDAWSQTIGERYKASAVRETWRSIKAGGGVGIGTLLHLAKAHGFDLKAPAAAVQTPEQAAQQARERAEQRQAEQQRIEAAQATAAAHAEQVWADASIDGSSPYLERKGVRGHGVRHAAGGVLLVPLRATIHADAPVLNLQRILPEKPAEGSNKLFIKGGRKSGLWHQLGDPRSGSIVLVAEGYATGASLHEATGHPVAIAFDAGNLMHVAKALRGQRLDMEIAVCGDDDVQTFATIGRNPGREKAEAAAKAVQGVAVFPTGLPEGASDFNDMHQAMGLQAVAEHVNAAIDSYVVQRSAKQKTPSNKARNAKRGTESDSTPVNASSHRDDPDEFSPFTVDDGGVWHRGIDSDGKRKAPEWVCSRLDVVALTRDQDGGGWGYLLAFADPLGKPKQWAMPARMLSGDGGEYRGMLLALGLRIAPSTRARNLLTQYIQTRQPEAFATCTDRIGWHGAAFVLPHETIGDDEDRVVFQSDSAMENTFRSRGTPEQWRERVAALCAGNSRLVFALACAFAGPLMRPTGMESGGFHLRGDSSSGKTTALRVAASLYGGPSYMQRWRTTDNALEAIAAQHCDSLLILDELAQVDPKTAGECAYMLANEQSKARATRNGAPRARLSWRLLFLSAGELGLADHMAEGMKRVRAGQEIRMADIPADAGAGMGAFEDLHGLPNGAELARALSNHVGTVYGATGKLWLQWLADQALTLKGRIRQATTALATEWMPAGASGQVERVGARFALVGAAGELAIEAGLTGWQPGESAKAAKRCFDAWLAARGGVGNSEVTTMLRTVRRFLEQHGEGRFTWWHRAADDHSAKTLMRAGYRRMIDGEGKPIKSDAEHQREYGERMPALMGEQVSLEYFVLAETFRSEICQGFDPQAVCRVLLEHGCLVPDKGRIYDCKPRLPGLGLSRCYRITPKLFELDV